MILVTPATDVPGVPGHFLVAPEELHHCLATPQRYLTMSLCSVVIDDIIVLYLQYTRSELSRSTYFDQRSADAETP